jgi:hypothetical protein
MKKFYFFLAFIFVVSGGVWGLAKPVNASLLSIQTDGLKVAQNFTFVVEVRLDSEKQIINAVQARITYDPQVLEFIQVSKSGSFLTLWAEEPKVDTTAGVITFTGGIPNGSYVISGRVISLVFRATTLGTTTIGIDSGTTGVYLNDGLGTKAALKVKAVNLEVIVPTSTLNITSSTQPEENSWYTNHTVHLEWTATQGAQYAYLLSEDPAALPDTRFGAFVDEASYTEVKDGIHYFILQEHLPNDTWGSPVRRRVLIDSTSPEAFTPTLTSDVVPGKLVLVFQATDSTSGVVKYDVQEGDTVSSNATSPYTLRDQQQKSTLTIKAYDSAGNVRVATIAANPTASRQIPYLPIAGGIAVVIIGGLLFWRLRR